MRSDAVAPNLITAGSVGAVLCRPGLWGVAVRMVVALARRGWWRQWPPVPTPDPAYLAWRAQTAYGGDGSPPPHADAAADLVSFLTFARSLRDDRPT